MFAQYEAQNEEHWHVLIVPIPMALGHALHGQRQLRWEEWQLKHIQWHLQLQKMCCPGRQSGSQVLPVLRLQGFIVRNVWCERHEQERQGAV